jgi:hypothetical protein
MRSTSCFDSVVKTNWALESISRVTASHKGIVSAVRHLPVPHEAKLSRDGTLTWRWESSVVTREWEKRVVPHRPRKVSSHLWKDFMTLADAEPEKIRAFSERWGPLRWAAIDCQSENVKHWRNFAQLASALIHCSVALGQGKPGTRSHWSVICQWLKIRLDPDLPKPDLAIPAGQKASVALYRRVLLAQALNVWHDRSLGNTLIALEKDQLVIAPLVITLFGIIGLQLAYRITGASEMMVCHHCTRFFRPEPQQIGQKRVFCPVCRKKAKPQLYAMRDYRARLRP